MRAILAMNKNKTYNVLFLCTGNSARSILGEAILNRTGKGRFKAFSAGSKPTGKVNEFALELLRSNGYSTVGMASKSWQTFADWNAPRIDFVFTVCDSAGKEVCPVWPGHPMTAHWGIADPAAVEGTDREKRAAFALAYEALSHRIGLFLGLPLAAIEKAALRRQLNEIGHVNDDNVRFNVNPSNTTTGYEYGR
jgi:protein-tyrosine-phosphatase